MQEEYALGSKRTTPSYHTGFWLYGLNALHKYRYFSPEDIQSIQPSIYLPPATPVRTLNFLPTDIGRSSSGICFLPSNIASLPVSDAASRIVNCCPQYCLLLPLVTPYRLLLFLAGSDAALQLSTSISISRFKFVLFFSLTDIGHGNSDIIFRVLQHIWH